MIYVKPEWLGYKMEILGQGKCYIASSYGSQLYTSTPIDGTGAWRFTDPWRRTSTEAMRMVAIAFTLDEEVEE